MEGKERGEREIRDRWTEGERQRKGLPRASMSRLVYLKIFEIIGISSPIDLREQILVEHFAQQLEEIHLALVVRLNGKRKRN